MKKILSMILLVASILVLIVSLVFCMYSIYDINRILDELANNPSASGIDYMGIGWGYSICLFATSTLGLILSSVSKKLQQQRSLQYISLAAIVIFLLLIIVSVFLFYFH